MVSNFDFYIKNVFADSKTSNNIWILLSATNL